MKLLALGGVVLVSAVLIARACVRHHRSHHVSGDWLKQRDQIETRNTFEGVSWNWGAFRRRFEEPRLTLRKRA